MSIEWISAVDEFSGVDCGGQGAEGIASSSAQARQDEGIGSRLRRIPEHQGRLQRKGQAFYLANLIFRKLVEYSETGVSRRLLFADSIFVVDGPRSAIRSLRSSGHSTI